MNGGVIITVRLVRSIEHRNVRPLVLRNVNLSMTLSEFKSFVDGEIQRANLPSVFKAEGYFDAFKLETWVNKAKSGNAVMNLESPVLSDFNKTLEQCGVGDESEINYFNLFHYHHMSI